MGSYCYLFLEFDERLDSLVICIEGYQCYGDNDCIDV